MCLSTLFVVYQAAAIASVTLAVILYIRAPQLLLLLVPAITAVVLTLFLRASLSSSNDKAMWVDVAGLGKLLCELPVGLGSILLFATQSVSTRRAHQRAFATFVNLAVLGNIAMMALLPGGGTFRGETSRAACLMLCAWLLLEICRVGWLACVPVSEGRQCGQGVFIFTASPLKWVLCHALYRAVMVTLPAFDTWRYLQLEPLSLGCMCVLHSYLTRLPSESPPVANVNQAMKREGGHKNVPDADVFHYFGIADTLVVATLGTLSHLSDHFIDPQIRPLTLTVPCSSSSSSSFSWPAMALPLPRFAVSTSLMDIVGASVHSGVIAVAFVRCIRLIWSS